MSKNKKQFVQDITNMEDDFAKWYTDIIKKADLVDYSPVKGFMVIKPYGYAIWENIKNYMDEKFKETGHENLYFPLLIPESLLNKEKDHVEGFAPEVAWVTHGGDEELSERLCIRPTSETIICTMYAKWLRTYRQLPFLYNQWANVVRWEKTTRPFLRTSEFLWQEGHTLHETEEEAKEETLKILDIYNSTAKNLLAIPMLVGAKSEKEKFAGAETTYTMEAIMHDGKALQSGTSHYLAQNFTKAFEITYQTRDETLKNPYHTSWGVSTRLIGGLIMVHSDNRGLVLPPRVAPIQVVIVPIRQENEGVLEKSNEICNLLKEKNIRVKLDDDDSNSPGWKYNEYEMKGVPIRIEIGPRDIENNAVMVFRRDTLEKEKLDIDNIASKIPVILDEIHDNLYSKALKNTKEKCFTAQDYEKIKDVMENNRGFVKTMWCGDEACEDKFKDDFSATIRCIPFEQEKISDKCVVCGKEAKHMVYVAKAY